MREKHRNPRCVLPGQPKSMSDSLRQTIRSILIEELQKHGINSSKEAAPSGTEEWVSIHTDQDLSRFVRRILELAKNAKIRADIESGRHIFRLETGGVSRDDCKNSQGLRTGTNFGEMINFDHGLVTEKQVLKMPGYVTTVNLGKSVTLTPLASDAIRRAGITIQRATT